MVSPTMEDSKKLPQSFVIPRPFLQHGVDKVEGSEKINFNSEYNVDHIFSDDNSEKNLIQTKAVNCDKFSDVGDSLSKSHLISENFKILKVANASKSSGTNSSGRCAAFSPMVPSSSRCVAFSPITPCIKTSTISYATQPTNLKAFSIKPVISSGPQKDNSITKFVDGIDSTESQYENMVAVSTADSEILEVSQSVVKFVPTLKSFEKSSFNRSEDYNKIYTAENASNNLNNQASDDHGDIMSTPNFLQNVCKNQSGGLTHLPPFFPSSRPILNPRFKGDFSNSTTKYFSPFHQNILQRPGFDSNLHYLKAETKSVNSQLSLFPKDSPVNRPNFPPQYIDTKICAESIGEVKLLEKEKLPKKLRYKRKFKRTHKKSKKKLSKRKSVFVIEHNSSKRKRKHRKDSRRKHKRKHSPKPIVKANREDLEPGEYVSGNDSSSCSSSESSESVSSSSTSSSFTSSDDSLVNMLVSLKQNKKKILTCLEPNVKYCSPKESANEEEKFNLPTYLNNKTIPSPSHTSNDDDSPNLSDIEKDIFENNSKIEDIDSSPNEFYKSTSLNWDISFKPRSPIWGSEEKSEAVIDQFKNRKKTPHFIFGVKSDVSSDDLSDSPNKMFENEDSFEEQSFEFIDLKNKSPSKLEIIKQQTIAQLEALKTESSENEKTKVRKMKVEKRDKLQALRDSLSDGANKLGKSQWETLKNDALAKLKATQKWEVSKCEPADNFGVAPKSRTLMNKLGLINDNNQCTVSTTVSTTTENQILDDSKPLTPENLKRRPQSMSQQTFHRTRNVDSKNEFEHSSSFETEESCNLSKEYDLFTRECKEMEETSPLFDTKDLSHSPDTSNQKISYSENSSCFLSKSDVLLEYNSISENRDETLPLPPVSNEKERLDSDSSLSSNDLEYQEFRLLESSKQLLSASMNIFKSPPSPKNAHTNRRYEKPVIKVEKTSRNKDLDNLFSKTRKKTEVSENFLSPKQKKFMSIFNYKTMKPHSRPPSPFKNNNRYHFWYRETYYFRKNPSHLKDFADPYHIKIYRNDSYRKNKPKRIDNGVKNARFSEQLGSMTHKSVVDKNKSSANDEKIYNPSDIIGPQNTTKVNVHPDSELELVNDSWEENLTSDQNNSKLSDQNNIKLSGRNYSRSSDQENGCEDNLIIDESQSSPLGSIWENETLHTKRDNIDENGSSSEIKGENETTLGDGETNLIESASSGNNNLVNMVLSKIISEIKTSLLDQLTDSIINSVLDNNINSEEME